MAITVEEKVNSDQEDSGKPEGKGHDDPVPEGVSKGETAVPEHDVAQYYLVFFQGANRTDPLGELNRFAVEIVQEKLDEAISTPASQTEIDVWLESPGGDAHAAYKLFLDLRNRCRRLRVIIPDYAKSAATLLALGADEIFMAAAAELGPLDAQIEHPDREGVSVSALDVANALDFLGTYAVNFTAAGGAELLQYTGLPRAAVLREFLKFAAMFLRPAIAKIDPHLTHRAANERDVAQRYAEIMLRRRQLAEVDCQDDFDATHLVHRLVRHYPTHGFVISRDEARELPLPVKNLELYPAEEEVKQLHKAYRNGVFSDESTNSVIWVWSEADLESLTGLDGGNQGEESDQEQHIGDVENPEEGTGGTDHETSQDKNPQAGGANPKTPPAPGTG